MLNKEVFEQYSTEQWVIEQSLCFMLQTYWDAILEDIKRGYNGSSMPINPVSFVKKFMKEETLCSVEYAEMSKMDKVEKNIIADVEFKEV